MKVALYARVSTKRQEKQGTIASQIEALRTYAIRNHYEVDEDYVCCDNGYSGALLARPASSPSSGEICPVGSPLVSRWAAARWKSST